MRLAFLGILITAALLGTATFFLVRYAQGYRFVFNKNAINVAPTGILVATSTPDGASVFVDGRLLSATDTTINLDPGDYTVKVIKEGYLPWEKRVKIQKEVVTETQALLFPSAPKLESITVTGVLRPTADPTRTRIAFGVASASASQKNGVFVFDMAERPILLLRDASLQIANDAIASLSRAQLGWSPNGKEIIATVEDSKATYLLRSSEFNQKVPEVTATLAALRGQWEKEEKEREKTKLDSLKPHVAEFIAKNLKIISWSNDNTKILYEASQSASMPVFIEPPLVGANTQPQERELKSATLYVYDTKEDRNFFMKEVDPDGVSPVWLASNRHLVFIEEKQIKVVEYDGTNKTVVYSGPLEGKFVYPWPDSSRLVILATLNPQAGLGPNLYTINLK